MEQVAEIRALFRKYLVADASVAGAEELVEWSQFREVLQQLDPATFTDSVLQDLLRVLPQAPGGGAEGDAPKAVPLDKLLQWVFKLPQDGARTVHRSGSGRRALLSRQSTLSKSKSFREEHEKESAPPDALKRAKSGDAAPADAGGGLNVRTPAGTVVLALKREDCEGLTAAKLKEKVSAIVGKKHQIKLIAGVCELQPSEDLEALAGGPVALEVLLVTQQVPQLDPDLPHLEQLDTLKAMLQSDSPEYQLDSACCFRKILSVGDREPPIDEVIQMGVVPRLLELARETDNPPLQFETLWAVTNVASGNSQQTQVVVDHGALPLLVELLRSSCNEDVFDQVVWAMGNIAGDSPALRDMALDAGAVRELLGREGSPMLQKVSVTRNMAWALSNLCRGKPGPPFAQVQPLLTSGLASRLINHDDAEVIQDACWLLSYMSDGPNEKIAAVLDAGVCPRLIELLSHDCPSVRTPALRTVGNLVTGDDAQTQAVLDCGMLPVMHQLLRDPKRGIRKEACWALSNITAGTSAQIQAVIDQGLVQPLLEKMAADGEADIKKEAAFALANAACQRMPEQITFLVGQGAVQCMAEYLRNVHDDRLKVAVLEFFEHVLAVPRDDQDGEDANEAAGPHMGVVREALSQEMLEGLSNVDSENVSERAAVVMVQLYP